ncbi:hypothetical protein BH09VER1_BH09VER1_19720 [soil metagenome]
MNAPWLSLLKSAFAEKAGKAAARPDLLPQWVYCGLETRTPDDRYVWKGLRRGADPRHPFALFQYTLEGEGRYEERGRSHVLRPGEAFVTLIPSAHIYELPRHSLSWSFYWIIVHHPDVLQRLIRMKSESGPVHALTDESPVHVLSARICQRTIDGGYEDCQACELALWEWTLELERGLSLSRSEAQGREQLLDWTRRQWANRPGKSLTVTQLARSASMSPSNFSHHFRKLTGLAPAQFLAQLRMSEVIRRLRDSDDKLQAVALDLGFTDASHLSRAVRQHYRLQPGVLRLLLRNQTGRGR